MKRATYAQRLAYILFSIALTSIALGAPPEHAEGNPPPFNQGDCVFEEGRTTCIRETIGEKTVIGGGAGGILDDTENQCSDGEVLVGVEATFGFPVWKTTTVFYGVSQEIEWEDHEFLGWEEEKDVLDSWCMTL